MSNRKAAQPRRRAVKDTRKTVATMVSGTGTDAEIAERCAKDVPGWDKMSDKGKADMVRLMRHFHNCPAVPVLQVVKSDDAIGLQTPDEMNPTLNAMRMVDAMGVSSDAFLNERIRDLTVYHNGNSPNGLSSQNLSAALAMIAGGNATDPVQSTLLVQMHCVHDAGVRALGKLGKSEYLPQAQMWGNLATKLFNTYARQAEVLAKLQRGGEQVVRHIHNYVDNRGGQAIIAENVTTGGGVNEKSREQAYEQGTVSPALLGSDPFRDFVPVPSREGAEAVPVTRLRPR